MKIDIDGMPVLWPFPYVYPEQVQFMKQVKGALDARGPILLESPTGTGKTIAILAAVCSYQLVHEDPPKLIYCSRTVPEIEKVLAELKGLVAYIDKYYKENNLPPPPADVWPPLALGLSARRTLCIHPVVSRVGEREDVDSACRQRTAEWVREAGNSGKARKVEHKPLVMDGDDGTAGLGGVGSVNGQSVTEVAEDNGLCTFYEGLDARRDEATLLARGVYSMDDLKDVGAAQGWCPYFTSRRLLKHATIVVYNFQYLLSPQTSFVSEEFSANSVVVFDEAHNIDNVCIESMSVNITRETLEAGTRNLNSLQGAVRQAKDSSAARLRAEYDRLVEGLAASGIGAATAEVVVNPVLPEDILHEAVPGNIRKADHFIGFLKRFVEYLKTRLRVGSVIQETPLAFLQNLYAVTAIEPKPLKFATERLASLLRTLEISNIQEYSYLSLIATFATLVGTYQKGFALIIEPYDSKNPTVPNPILQWACLDASLAIKPVFAKFRAVVITSGTLSPLSMYPKIMDFTPVSAVSLSMSLTRECVLPLVVTRGADQSAISSKYEMRNDPAVVRNFGDLLVQLSAVVPDGLVCFFTSYEYMEMIVSSWQDMGLLKQVLKNKLIFIETSDFVEASLALQNYKRACDCGRGAVFFSVARGKVSEGVDFDHQYGRCVVQIGIPYVYTESRILRARLEFLRTHFRIRENDFLTFDAMRTAAQCMGRVLRNKNDYGIMVFADKRYNRVDKRSKLPHWIAQYLTPATLNLSSDTAITYAKDYFRRMAQPRDKTEDVGKALWTEKHVAEWQAARESGQEYGPPVMGPSQNQKPLKTRTSSFPEGFQFPEHGPPPGHQR